MGILGAFRGQEQQQQGIETVFARALLMELLFHNQSTFLGAQASRAGVSKHQVTMTKGLLSQRGDRRRDRRAGAPQGARFPPYRSG